MINMPRCARAESETARLLRQTVLLLRAGLEKNVYLLVAYLGSSVELAHDLGRSVHGITMYYDMMSSVLRECRKLKSPSHIPPYLSAWTPLTSAEAGGNLRGGFRFV